MNATLRHTCFALISLTVLSMWAAGAPPVKAPRPNFTKAVPSVDAVFEPATARRGQTILWKMTAKLSPGHYTYAAVQVDKNAEAQKTEFTFPASDAVVFVGDLKEPPYKVKALNDVIPPIMELRYLDEPELTWVRPVVVSLTAKPGKTTVKAEVRIVVCNAKTCLPPQTLYFETPLTITDEAPQEVESQFRDAVASAKPPTVPPTPTNGNTTILPPSPATGEKSRKGPPLIETESPEKYRAELEALVPLLVQSASGGAASDAGGLLAFILSGIFWGAVSLVTPCVFPMIPITVSYFLKQSEKAHHRPITMAAVYCGTIVVVLTIAAVLLLSVFRALSIHPLMNFGIGLLFIFFAFSLFGWYEIELPSSLAQFTSAQEGKGGLVGTMFMALTFTILSFACVAPFLGGFGGTAGTGRFSLAERLLGGLAFAVTFASPFFVLALFPSLLKKMPKSGSWMNSVKVVMGFLELAAAFKFFRLGELLMTPKPMVFTFDLIMGVWVAIALLCALYLLGVFRLPHDSPVENLSVPRMIMALIFLGIGFYLLPSLFKSSLSEKQRPSGAVYAWVDSFLLPESSEGALPWSGNLPGSIELARAERARTNRPQYVFIDFTGKSCTNCSINEHTVFSRPEFKDLLGSYQLVQLYTDVIPDSFFSPQLRSQFKSGVSRQKQDASANLDFQLQAFSTEQLPLYVILEPLPGDKVEVVGVYDEGKINNEAAFAEFLRKPLDAAGGARASK